MARFLMILVVFSVCFHGGRLSDDDACPSHADEEIERLEEELSGAQAELKAALVKRSKLLERREWQEKTVSKMQQQLMMLRGMAGDMSTIDTTDMSIHKRQTCDNHEHLRLVNGTSDFEGRLEVKNGDIWMNVCENGWDVHSAQLVCSMLGYPGREVAAVGGRVFGDGTEPQLQAGGACSHSAGVICGELDKYPVRLVNGSYPNEGRVEILIGGEWGTICHNGWTYQDAQVICNMLGYHGSGAAAVGGALFGEGTGQSWLRDAACTGSEKHILSCRFTYPPGFISQCGHNGDAGVICGNMHHYPVRLVNGSTGREGRVEIRINGQWSSIYDGRWEDRDAQVVCRMLGYDWQGAKATLDSYFGPGTGVQLLANLDCAGTEDHILDCPTGYSIGSNRNLNNHGDDAGVICPPCSYCCLLPVRLTP